MSETLSIPQAIRLAGRLLNENRSGEAKVILGKVLRVVPNHASAIHLTGVALYQEGRADAALTAMHRAVTLEPNNADYLGNLCELCRQRGRSNEAIGYGERAIAQNPRAVSALANLGICYYDEKDYDKAQQLQERAIAIDPNCVPALNNLGSIAKQKKELDTAREYFEQVLFIKPNHVESLSNLGAVHLAAERLEEALSTATRAIELDPSYAEAHSNLGSTLVLLNRKKEAFRAYLAAIKIRPNYYEAILGVARLYLAENQLSEALARVNNAIQIRPDDADGYALLGDIQAAAGAPADAGASFAKARQLEPEHLGAILSSGHLAVELGDLAEAATKFNEVLSIDQENLSAKTALVTTHKIEDDDRIFLDLVKISDDIEQMYDLKAIPLHFALGKGFDDLKDYATAFSHYLAGCKIKRKHITFDIEKHAARVDEIKAFFTADRLTQLRGDGCQDDTPIFVLGMPRSGTTLTEQIIASHSQVFGAGELRDLMQIVGRRQSAETEGFPASFLGVNSNQLAAVGSDYVEGLRKHAPEAKHITDKMPANYQLVGLIHLILPNAKIVHVRRSPVDTCLSNFSKHFAHNNQPQSYDLREIGLYYRHYDDLMKHWRSVLPVGAWFELDYENLVEDTESQARALIEYCGLPWEQACLDFHKTKRSVKTASVTQVRQPIYKTSVERWRAYIDHLGPLFDALGPLAPDEITTASEKPPAKNTAARKPPAKRPPSQEAPAKTAETKKALTKQAPATKARTKKAPVKKAPAKKAPVKKAPVKKASSGSTAKASTTKKTTKNTPNVEK